MLKLRVFFKEVFYEAKNITWPTNIQVLQFGLVVIITVLLMSIFSGMIDFFVEKIVFFLLKLNLPI